jgi:hypothetical protein
MARDTLRHKATGIEMDVNEINRTLADGPGAEWELILAQEAVEEREKKPTKRSKAQDASGTEGEVQDGSGTE